MSILAFCFVKFCCMLNGMAKGQKDKANKLK